MIKIKLLIIYKMKLAIILINYNKKNLINNN